MKRFDGPSQAFWDPAWERGAWRARGSRALHAQALRVRATCPPLGVRAPLYVRVRAGLCARRRSLQRRRRSHRDPALRVEAGVVAVALFVAAAFWLMVIQVLWGVR